MVDIDKQNSVLMADIPGLIEGAADGRGLGHEFLRHIERTRLIVHVIDIYEEDIAKVYKVIRKELEAHSKHLAKLPELVVLNKVDGYDPKLLKDKEKSLKAVIGKKTDLLTISAKAGINLAELKFSIKNNLDRIKPKKTIATKPDIPRITLPDSAESYKVTKEEGGGYRLTGERLERFAGRTDFSNEEALDRFRDILRRMGVIHELTRRGLRPGDLIYIGKNDIASFNF